MTEPTTHPVPQPAARPEDAVPPMLAALRDLIAADPGAMAITEALASARTVLAAHARELAERFDNLAAPDCSEMDTTEDAWECGNTDTVAAIREYADQLAAGGDR
jgi:hypothetical protein